MKKSTWFLKLSFLAVVLFLWTNASAQGITEVESITCPGNTDGQLSFTATGSGNTYLWSNGSTEQTIKKLSAGTYTLTISAGPDAGGSPYTYTLKDPNPIIVTSIIVSNNSTWGTSSSGCDGALTVFNTGGTGQISYIMYDVLTRETFTTSSISNRPPGDYLITLTDENGCTKDTTATIGDDAESTLTTVPASDTTYVCYKKTAGSTVIPSSDDIYPVYTEFSGTTDLGKDTTAIDSAMYYVLDTTLVSGTDYAAIYLDSIDYWSIPVSDNNDTLMFLSKTPVTSTSTAGVYTDLQILKSSNVDFGFTADINVLQPDSSLITRTIVDTLIQGTSTSLAVSNLEPGFYTAYFWNSRIPNSEGKRGVWDILGPNNPVTVNYTQTNILCFGDSTGQITADAQGSWHDYSVPFAKIDILKDNSIIDSISNSNSISTSGLAAGIYSITATDVNGCSRTQTVEITQPDDSLYISYDVTKFAKCPYSSDGEVTINRVVGGTAPFKNIIWDGDSTNNEVANSLTAGLHSVVIIDNDDCRVSDSIYVNFTSKSCFYNIVTPNGDGYNDYFDLTDMCQNMQMEAKVFNEQGKLVTTLDETNPKWDAYDPSTPPTGPSSTYTAFIKLTKDGEKIAEFGESFSVIYSK